MAARYRTRKQTTAFQMPSLDAVKNQIQTSCKKVPQRMIAEYKRRFNIGTRKAAEKIVTYDESLPLYESIVNCQRSIYEETKYSNTAQKMKLTLGKRKHDCQVASKLKNKQLKQKSKPTTIPVTKNQSSSSGPKVERKTIKSVKKQKPASKSLVKDCFVKLKREASLNASAKVNVFYETAKHAARHPPPISRGELSDSKETHSKRKNNCSSSIAKVKKQKLDIGRKTKEGQVKSNKNNSQDLKKKSKCKPKSAVKCEKHTETNPKNKTTVTKKTKKTLAKRKKDVIAFIKDVPKQHIQKFARRMASLNAEAFMAVTKEPRKNTLICARIKTLPSPRTVKQQTLFSAHWVDGLGPTFCQTSESLQMSNMDVTILSKSPVTALISKEDPEAQGESRPTSIVDVTGAYQPKAMGLNSSNFTNTVIAPGHISSPLPTFTYTPNTVEIPVSQCQSFTLSGVGSISSLHINPFHRPFGSAFSVPYNHTTVSHYGYYPSGYYQPAGPVIQAMADSCILPHAPLVQVPQGEVKVLIHNPHSEHPFIKQPPEDDIIEDKKFTDIKNIIEINKSETMSPSVNLGPNADKKCRRRSSLQKQSKTNNSEKSLEPVRKHKGLKDESNLKRTTSKEKKKASSAEQMVKVNKKQRKVKTKSDVIIDIKQKDTISHTEPCDPILLVEKKSFYGWSWHGEPEMKSIPNLVDGPMRERKCYNAIQHEDGDFIKVCDCVLLRSGPRKKDVPFVAKVTAFWEHPEEDEMMMSLLWYYRPEHTETGRLPRHVDNEIFASKHKDENSIACIEDKCFVLTFNEYGRYIAEQVREESNAPLRQKVVPEQEEQYIRMNKLPALDADLETVFLCRQVYDFRQKRILKNPM